MEADWDGPFESISKLTFEFVSEFTFEFTFEFAFELTFDAESAAIVAMIDGGAIKE